MDSTPLQAIARVLRTLSDPNRLKIIRVLTMDCESVSTIVERTGLPQPLVSHHLRVLREQGLARPERRGAFTFYCLSDESIGDAIEHVANLTARLRETAKDH
jgi:ArsR family transcriptional regulator